jgi:hypothetical protein
LLSSPTANNGQEDKRKLLFLWLFIFIVVMYVELQWCNVCGEGLGFNDVMCVCGMGEMWGALGVSMV